MKVRKNLRCQLTTGGLLLRLQCMLGAPFHPCKIFCCCFPTWLCHNRFHLLLAWPWWPSKWFILYNCPFVSNGWKLVWLVCFLIPIQTRWCSSESLPFVLRAWSKCVLCILGGSPNECWLHTCDACVITTWHMVSGQRWWWPRFLKL